MTTDLKLETTPEERASILDAVFNASTDEEYAVKTRALMTAVFRDINKLLALLSAPAKGEMEELTSEEFSQAGIVLGKVSVEAPDYQERLHDIVKLLDQAHRALKVRRLANQPAGAGVVEALREAREAISPDYFPKAFAHVCKALAALEAEIADGEAAKEALAEYEEKGGATLDEPSPSSAFTSSQSMGRTEPFLTRELEDRAGGDDPKWTQDALRLLAAQLGVMNDFYFPLIGAADRIDELTASATSDAPKGARETAEPSQLIHDKADAVVRKVDAWIYRGGEYIVRDAIAAALAAERGPVHELEEKVNELEAERQTLLTRQVKARPLSEWHENTGLVLWWKFPIEEAPYLGSPLDQGRLVKCNFRGTIIWKNVGGWPGYHTHWTPIGPLPSPPEGGDK